MNKKTPRELPKVPTFYFDPGRGQVQGVGSDVVGIVEFSPVVAPMTNRRGLSRSDEYPTFSLIADGRMLVFGTDDVYRHGVHDSIRRLSTSEDQQFSDDYQHLLEVLWLHIFSGRRGNRKYIEPRGIINIPIDLYNNEQKTEQLKRMICGKKVLEDSEGCQLKLNIREENLMLLPEGSGAMFHYALNEDGKVRRGSPTAGVTVIIDIGYETTHVSTWIGTEYQRDRDLSFTIDRAGMGVIAREVREFLNQRYRGVEDSRVDDGLREIAGEPRGSVKKIEFAPDTFADVSPVYDVKLDDLARRITDRILTRIQMEITRVGVSGGGSYHLKPRLQETFGEFQVVEIPNPDRANVLGLKTYGEQVIGG